MLDSIRDKEILSKMVATPKLSPEARARLLREVSQRLKFRVLTPWRKSRIGFDEAYFLGMYHGEKTDAEMARYVGRMRQSKFHLACNDSGWFATAQDKALYYTILKGAGLAVPEPLGFVGTKRREGFGIWIGSPEALQEFFNAQTQWPLFTKPVDGMFSLGAMKLLGLDGDMLQVQNEEPVRVPELWQYMNVMSARGFLIQSCLRPSAFAAQNFSDVIASVRMLVLFSGSEPQIESAVLKIPGGQHVADNFWRPGNMLAAVDETGKITRVLMGKGLDQKQVDMHPVTGVHFAGLQIPNWSEISSEVIKAAALMPGIRTQSWDVGLTENGPHLLEVNFGGDLDLHQMAHQRGILSDNYIMHLVACGVKLTGV